MADEFHSKIHQNLDSTLRDQGSKIDAIQSAVSDLKSQVSKIEGKIYAAGAIVGVVVSVLPRLIDMIGK